MKILKPQSISQLVIGGFLLVAVPLIAALLQVGVSVDSLAKQSERATLQAVRATQLSRMLVEHITAMERNARQYQVLGEPALYRAYKDNHLKFSTTLEELSNLPLIPTQRTLLEQLIVQEDRMKEYLSDDSQLRQAANLTEDFIALSSKAQNLLAHNSQLIDKGVAETHEAAKDMQTTLYWQGGALLPVVVLGGLLFIILITRPIRQIDDAIRRLGDGEFNHPVRLQGPKEIEFLGERLDWLRTRLSEVEAQKLKFLRHISHELKTPLTNIREGSELITEEVAGTLNDNQKEIANIIKDNGIYLQRLIEDLLKFGGAKDKKLTLKKSYFCLDDLIDEVLKKNKLMLVGKKVRIRKNFKSPSVLADREMIRIVIDNLISNACKYSPEGGSIRIATGRSAKYAMLGVADDGPGIAQEHRKYVFEAFYQGNENYISHVKGTGLGLSIAKEYVDAHEGKIDIVDGKGSGAYFVVKIPLDADEVQGVA